MLFTSLSGENEGTKKYNTAGKRRWKSNVKQREVMDSIYKSGLHSPSEDQVLEITATLQQYGQIETRNVERIFRAKQRKDKEKAIRLQLLHRRHTHGEGGIKHNRFLYLLEF